MKLLFLFLFIISIVFSGCVGNDAVSKEECQSLGLKFTKEKVLNYRTGKYEVRSYCKQY